jgi:2-amino-4-hydroxy-6-hydroxymethyldihydropteridine diphosphokinase
VSEIPAAITKVVLALGSNIGDRAANLRRAVEALAPYVDIERRSPIYETAPAYVTDQALFLNAVVTGTTRLEPYVLLRAVKDLESELGREPTFHYGPRAIDIDIIFYGDVVLRTAELIIPHPRVGEREFVLRPLADIAPDFIHPETRATVSAMLARIPHSLPERFADQV